MAGRYRPAAMTREGSGIEVEGLVREFKGGIRAVDGIDLRVAPGEIYGFLGPNGAGKSTTVLMLTTLLPPTAGRASVAGFDVLSRRARGAHAHRRRAAGGRARQLPDGARALRPPGRAARDEPRRTGPRRADELLARVGLEDAADRKVGGYSGGMRRRLDLALALVHHPSILFLDEPTTGLDPQSRSSLWDEVARLAREDGVTVFLTTQYLEEADVLADRVGIIDRGKIVAEGTPEALKARIGGASVEVEPVDPGDLERLRSVLGRFGEPAAGSADRAPPCSSTPPSWPRSSARSTPRAIRVANLAAARAVSRRRLPGGDGPLAGGRRRG